MASFRASPTLLAHSFVAIDFETANLSAVSACAVGLVRVEGDAIVARETRLIRPPSAQFVFTHVHGLTWEDVCDAPPFAEVWRDVAPLLEGASFLVAHNAGFDRAVLRACCAGAAIAPPELPYECTVKWSRRVLGARPANLPAVCRLLGIPLRHHDPGSDAEACARIMIAVRKAVREREGAAAQ